MNVLNALQKLTFKKSIQAQADWPRPGRDRTKTEILLQESPGFWGSGIALTDFENSHKPHKSENFELGRSETALPSEPAYTSLRIASPEHTLTLPVHSNTNWTMLWPAASVWSRTGTLSTICWNARTLGMLGMVQYICIYLVQICASFPSANLASNSWNWKRCHSLAWRAGRGREWGLIMPSWV